MISGKRNDIVPLLFASLMACCFIKPASGKEVVKRQATLANSRPVDPQTIPVEHILQSYKQSQAARSRSYTSYSAIRQTSFDCRKTSGPGYYADPEMGCQQYHRCDEQLRRSTFLCPPGTLFNQLILVCDFPYNVDCSQAAQYVEYSNSRLYQQKLPFLGTANGLVSGQMIGSSSAGGSSWSSSSSATSSQNGYSLSSKVGLLPGSDQGSDTQTGNISTDTATGSGSDNGQSDQTSNTASGGGLFGMVNFTGSRRGQNSQSSQTIKTGGATQGQSGILSGGTYGSLVPAPEQTSQQPTPMSSGPVESEDDEDEGSSYGGRARGSRPGTDRQTAAAGSQTAANGSGQSASVQTHGLISPTNSVSASSTEASTSDLGTTWSLPPPSNVDDTNGANTDAADNTQTGSDTQGDEQSPDGQDGAVNDMVSQTGDSVLDPTVTGAPFEGTVTTSTNSPIFPRLTSGLGNQQNQGGQQGGLAYVSLAQNSGSRASTGMSVTSAPLRVRPLQSGGSQGSLQSGSQGQANQNSMGTAISSGGLRVNVPQLPTIQQSQWKLPLSVFSGASSTTLQQGAGQQGQAMQAGMSNARGQQSGGATNSQAASGSTTQADQSGTQTAAGGSTLAASPIHVQVVTACDARGTLQFQGDTVREALLSSLISANGSTSADGSAGSPVTISISSSSADAGSANGIDPSADSSTGSSMFTTNPLVMEDSYYIYESADKPVFIKFAKYNVVVEVRPEQPN